MGDSVELGSDNLRGLAHPLRVQILGLLRAEGPSTATALANRLSLTSGALSYHLRQLERFGFIVDDPSRGNQRERWWRAAHRRTVYTAPAAGAAEPEAEVYLDGVVDGAVRALRTAQQRVHDLPEPWQQVQNLSDVLLQLTPQEASRLAEELLQLLFSYRQHDPDEPVAAGRRRVSVQFQLLPAVDDLTVGAATSEVRPR